MREQAAWEMEQARDRGRPHLFLQAGGPPDGRPHTPLHHVLLPHQNQGLPELILAALEPDHDLVDVFWILFVRIE